MLKKMYNQASDLEWFQLLHNRNIWVTDKAHTRRDSLDSYRSNFATKSQGEHYNVNHLGSSVQTVHVIVQLVFLRQLILSA